MADITKRITTYGGSLVRHALTAAGALLVARGLVTQTEITVLDGVIAPKVLGAFLYVLGQGWSLVQKEKVIEKT